MVRSSAYGRPRGRSELSLPPPAGPEVVAAVQDRPCRTLLADVTAELDFEPPAENRCPSVCCLTSDAVPCTLDRLVIQAPSMPIEDRPNASCLQEPAGNSEMTAQPRRFADSPTNVSNLNLDWPRPPFRPSYQKPELTGSMKFLHTADWQWGMPARFIEDDEARARYKSARFESVRRIAGLVQQEGCAFVVVCGDVYDANQLSDETVARTIEVLRAFTVPVYLLPGNHDPYDPGSIYRRPEFERVAGHVHVLREPGVHHVADGVELVAAPWTSKRPVEDLVAAQLRRLAPAPGGPARILVGHGAIDMLSPDRDRPDLIAAAEIEAALDDRRVHYVALGDKHSVLDVLRDGRVWYSGTPEVTDYDEPNPGSVLVVEIDDTGGLRSVTPHRTGTWTFEVVHAELGGAQNVEALHRRLEGLPDKDRTAIRLALRGTLDLREYARLEQVVDEHAKVFAQIRLWDRQSDIAVLPDDGEVDGLNLTGYAAAAFDELRRSADAGGNGAVAAQDALKLFFRLLGGVR